MPLEPPSNDPLRRHATVMAALKNRLSGLCAFVPADKPVMYLDYPMHLNVGDQLINLGTEAWFSDHAYTVIGRASVLDCTERDLAKIGPDTTIVLHGGGNFGDIYDVHQNFREMVVERFPGNKIVVMPQSVHFQSAERLRKAAAIFSRHPDLTIAVRDRESHTLLTDHFANPVHLFPDMAHQLWLTEAPSGAHRADDARTLCLWREDVEGLPYTDQFGLGKVEFRDWESLITVHDIRVFKAVKRWYGIDRKLGHRFPNHAAWYAIRRFIVERMIRLFREQDLIVTNRLHAIILACLTNIDVVFADNSYGKLSRYHSAWLDGCRVRPAGGS